MPTKPQRPNGIYEQVRSQQEQASQALSEAGGYATECIQSHPKSTMLATFAVGMVAGTCLVSLFLQPEEPRTWRDEAYDLGNAVSDRVKRYVPSHIMR